MHVYWWELGGGPLERLPGHGGEPKIQPHQIILDLNLTALKFNVILTVILLIFSSTVTEGSMSIKSGWVPERGMMRLSKGRV